MPRGKALQLYPELYTDAQKQKLNARYAWAYGNRQRHSFKPILKFDNGHAKPDTELALVRRMIHHSIGILQEALDIIS